MMPWNQVGGNPQPNQMNPMAGRGPNPMNPMAGRGPNPMMGNFGMNPSYQVPPAQMAYHQQFMQQPMFQQQAMNSFNHHRMNSMMPQQPALPPNPSLPPTPAGPPPQNVPPPPPSDDAKTAAIPPPPDSAEQWWRAELDSLQGPSREELSRLIQADWFLAMSTGQQIECWQHKMQLKSKQGNIFDGKSPSKTIVTNPIQGFDKPEVMQPKTSEETMKEQPKPPDKDPMSEWNENSGENPRDALQRCQTELENLKKQERVFEKQYTEWRGQFDAWKAKHENHPNKTQFQQYEDQWMTWQEQMLGQKKQNEANMERLTTNIKKIEQALAAPVNTSQQMSQQKFQPYKWPPQVPSGQPGLQSQNQYNNQHPPGFSQQFNSDISNATNHSASSSQNQYDNLSSRSINAASQESDRNIQNDFSSNSQQHHQTDEQQPPPYESWHQQESELGQQTFLSGDGAHEEERPENQTRQPFERSVQHPQQQRELFEGNRSVQGRMENFSNSRPPLRPPVNQTRPRFGEQRFMRQRFPDHRQQIPRFPTTPQQQRHRFPRPINPAPYGQSGDKPKSDIDYRSRGSRMSGTQPLQPHQRQQARFNRPKVYNEQGIEEGTEQTEDPEVYVDGEAISTYLERSQHEKSFSAPDNKFLQRNERMIHNQDTEVNDFGDDCFAIDNDDTQTRSNHYERFNQYKPVDDGMSSRFQSSDARSRSLNLDSVYDRQSGWSRGRATESNFQREATYQPPHTRDHGAMSTSVDMQTAQQLAEKNPLFQGDNMKKLQEQLKAITRTDAAKDVEKIDAEQPDAKRLDDKVLEKANTISSVDLKNILSAVRSATSFKDTESPTRSQSDHSRQSFVDRDQSGGDAPRHGVDPLLDSLTSLAAVGALEDDLVLQEYLKLDPALEQELYLRAMQDKDLLKEAQQLDPSFGKSGVASQNLKRRNSDKDRDLDRNSAWSVEDRSGRGRTDDNLWEPPRQDFVYPPADHPSRQHSDDRFPIQDSIGRPRDESPFRDLRDANQRSLERESIEKRHNAINRDLASVQQRRSVLDNFHRGPIQSQGGNEEEERRRRERSLERLRMREEELHARERDLRSREEMLRDALRQFSPSRQRYHDDPSSGPSHRSGDRRSPRLSSHGTSPPRSRYHSSRTRGSPHRYINEFSSGRDFPPRYPGDLERRRMSRSPPRHMPRSPPRRMPLSPHRRMPQSPPRRMLQSPPRRMPQSPPRRMPQSPPRRMPQSPPRRMPQSPPRRMPQSPPRRMPQLPPRRMPQSPPRRMPQSPPQRMPQSPPRRMPQSPPRRRPQSPPRRMPQSPERRKSRSPPRGAPPRGYIDRRPRGRDSPKHRSPPRKMRRSRTPPMARGKDEFGRDLVNRNYPGPHSRPSPLRDALSRVRDSSPRRRESPRNQPLIGDRKSPVRQRGNTPSSPLPGIEIKPTGRPITFADVKQDNSKPATPLLVNVDDVINMPGRLKRASKIAVIMRGLPGCGKTHVAKMIRDKESTFGVSPRVLGLDDYFMTEVEKVTTDDAGKKTKKKVLEYEYEEEMESSYRGNLIRSFKRTLEDGYFTFVIVDAINDKVDHFKECYDAAKTSGFEVYVAEIHADDHVCARRNTHNRTLEEIQKLRQSWQETPSYMNKLDLRMIIQDGAIQEVEMGDITDSEDESKTVEVDTLPQEPDVARSKWENEVAQLDKLDGISKKRTKKSMDDFLSVTEDYVKRESAPGKKRVRWADIHERENQQRMRDVGFVVGQTDWSRMMDDSHATQALNKTKFI